MSLSTHFVVFNHNRSIPLKPDCSILLFLGHWVWGTKKTIRGHPRESCRAVSLSLYALVHLPLLLSFICKSSNVTFLLLVYFCIFHFHFLLFICTIWLLHFNFLYCYVLPIYLLSLFFNLSFIICLSVGSESSTNQFMLLYYLRLYWYFLLYVMWLQLLQLRWIWIMVTSHNF